MRVLQIGCSGTSGGIENFVFCYNKELIKDGILFDYVCTDATIAFRKDIETLSENIYFITSEKNNPIRYFFQLVRIVKRYDVVHINMLSAANMLPLIACKLGGVKKIIVHSHSSETDDWIRRCLHYFNKPLVGVFADVYLACSDYAAKWLYIESLLKHKPVTIIKNAVSYDKYKFSINNRNSIRSRLGISYKTKVIGCVGRVTYQKNILFMLECIKCLVDKNEDIVFVHIGFHEEEYGRLVKEKIKQLNISNYVKFLGVRKDVGNFYSAFDVFCMPSIYEGLSLTAIEAQCSGVRCFFSDAMSRQTKVNENVEFLPIESAWDWANKIALASDERLDGSITAKNMEQSGFNINYVVKELKNVYLSSW